MIDFDYAKFLVYNKYVITYQTLYFTNVAIPKFAILVFYKRLFPLRVVQYIIYITSTILLCGTVANTVTFLVEYDVRGTQIKRTFLAWASVVNMVTDCIILVLPLPIIWKLPNSVRIKIALTSLFVIGGL